MTAGIEAWLASVRAGWDRITPTHAATEAAAGALLVDIRPLEQRRRQGDVPGAVILGRTVLEWRLAPTSAHRIPQTARDARVIVLCGQGYSSSVAVTSLRALGLDATDVVGGVEAWTAAGLPIEPCHGPSPEEASGFDAV
ncbi:MAG TPA: rhodanese-like domain-containing protein [Acidimicrobiia bacterium]|nr:rhodanese-like domain-containing protein [Acidimicrobiia bacterium]